MADYFTLDPAYQHYALGGVKLAFRTVYNEGYLGRMNSIGFVTSAGILGMAVISLLVRGIIAGRRSGQVGVFVAGIVIVVSLIIYVAGSTWLHFRLIRSKLGHLQKSGVLIDGTLISCVLNTKPAYWRGDTKKKYLNARYEFTTPDQQRLRGTQIRILDEMWDNVPTSPGTPVRYKWTHELAINQTNTGTFPFQPKGTPIRVLYADPETYVTL